MKKKLKPTRINELILKFVNLIVLVFGLFFIPFALQSCKTNKSATMPHEKGNREYVILDKAPAFPGGEEARVKFLLENMIYPQLAREKGYEGIVYVTFIVERDGRITEVNVLRGVHPSLDEEAIRVIKMMPNWIPGSHNGEPIRVQYNMPINFRLEKKGKKN